MSARGRARLGAQRAGKYRHSVAGKHRRSSRNARSPKNTVHATMKSLRYKKSVSTTTSKIRIEKAYTRMSAIAAKPAKVEKNIHGMGDML